MATFLKRICVLTRLYVAPLFCVLTCTFGSAQQGCNGPPDLIDAFSEPPGQLPSIATVLNEADAMALDEVESRLDHDDWLEFAQVLVATTHLQETLLDSQSPVQDQIPAQDQTPAQDQQSESLFELGFQALLDSLEEPQATVQPEPASIAPLDQVGAIPTELSAMVQRIDELETIIQANEDATRTIIRQTFAEQGSKINDFVIFGGTFELLTAWEEDFDGETASDIVLDTAELDFEIQVNNWVLGSLILQYEDGTSLLFPTSTGSNAFIDRINLDTAYVTIGDTQRFCVYTTLGRVVTPFGISTGAAKGQVLNLIDPLTVEVFETKQDVVLIGLEGPTPPPPPPVSTIRVPPPPVVNPLLLNPLVSRFSQCLGYRRPPPPRPPVPVPAPYVPKRPSYKGEIFFYNGDTFDGGFDHIEHMGGALSLYKEGRFCRCLPIIAPVPNTPWSMDFGLNVTSSVFDSQYLQFEYRGFLDQIGYVPGMAAHMSSAFGPLSLIAEWNGAVSNATFVDDLGDTIDITPGGWQVSLGYQFDWNPSVVEIGAQGTYFAIGYSESYDLWGATRLIDLNPFHPPAPEEVRVGFVPKKRFVVGMGEWLLDGLRVAVEYSHAVDYDIGEGLGTGGSANGVFGVVTYEW